MERLAAVTERGGGVGTTIETREGLRAWLEQWFDLHDARVLTLSPEPPTGDDAVPDRVTIELEIQVGGGYSAGDTRDMRGLVLEAEGVVRYDLCDLGFSPGHCSAGTAALDDAERPVALAVGVPGELELVCSRLHVTVREWTDVVPQRLSEWEFTAEVGGSRLPTPEEWVEVLADRGLDVCWRYADGGAKDANAVPANYEGWYLQHSRLIASTTCGLFFFVARSESPEEWLLTLTDQAADGGALWRAVGEFVAGQPRVAIRCGNDVLTAAEWREYLGTLADRR